MLHPTGMKAKETGVVSFLREVLGKKTQAIKKTQGRCEGCSL